MTDAQFARYSDDNVVEVEGQFIVTEGIGWADPDSGFSIEGVGDDGVELYGPRMINASNISEAYSFHPGGANFVMADGSIRVLHEGVDPWLFITLCTRSGREISSQ